MTLRRVALSGRERGQVVVLFALLLPLILGIGSIVVTIGNWYVHKKHLQTLVDAGAFAGGQYFTGCFQNPSGTNSDIAAAALKYAGDPNRDETTQNRQLEDPQDAHVVLNSTAYWTGNPYPLDNTLGAPCAVKFLDVKATEDKIPLLFKWLPATPSPKPQGANRDSPGDRRHRSAAVLHSRGLPEEGRRAVRRREHRTHQEGLDPQRGNPARPLGVQRLPGRYRWRRSECLRKL